MRINWRLKSCFFRFIDFLSLYNLLYFLQKNITRRSKVKIDHIEFAWLTHENHLWPIQNPRLIEFGAGKHLGQNIYLSKFAKEQVVVDLFSMLDMSEFNSAAAQIARLTNLKVAPVFSLSDIRNNYGITYLAPFDIAKSSFDDDSFDACISSYTLEHIPKGSIYEIFKELKRIIRNEGIISAIIDYSDHYAHTDNSISRLNYLSFNSMEFERYNHKSHYQNRLRHYNYADIFRELGFVILKSEALNRIEPPSEISGEFNVEDDATFATLGVFLLRVEK